MRHIMLMAISASAVELGVQCLAASSFMIAEHHSIPYAPLSLRLQPTAESVELTGGTRLGPNLLLHHGEAVN